jgi:periplasmic protein TonB
MPQPTSANGAPLHFESIDLSARHGRAQTFSIGAHAVLLALLIFALASPPMHDPPPNFTPLDANTLSYIPPLDPHSTAQNPSLGRSGSGGEDDPRPTRPGDLAPPSSMPLVPPRLTHEENVALPAPPTVLDPNAPTDATTITHLGLPWMSSDTDSAGPGRNHGLGSGNNGTMGDGAGNGAGAGDSDPPYANVASPVTCLYCPEPPYSEEARKAKLQGKMLLRVLVGPDGKAQRIQIVQGLGMGLDERAEDTIRTWRFSPARDAAKRPVACWVTIETRFQLF